MYRNYLLIISISLTIFSCGGGESTDENEGGVQGSLTLDSISPPSGVVTGGSSVTITGSSLNNIATVSIGGEPCTSVTATTDTAISCTTGSNSPYGGLTDVVVTTTSGANATLVNGYEYTCPWLHNGLGNCGAVPPPVAPSQATSFTVTTFQSGHGFGANGGGGGAHNYNDTGDFNLGTQSAFITSNGGGTAKTLKKIGIGPYDFTGKMLRMTVKIENTLKASSLQLYVGDTNLANHYKFSFLSTQGQLWITEGDWVTFTIPWTGSHVTTSGTPSRSNITDFQLRIVDDSTGGVTAHINEISSVAEQTTYPNGVASITFDDGFISQYSVAKPLMDAKSYTATAYVVPERIDSDGDYLTLTQLKGLQTSGWEIAAHAYTQATHASSYTGMVSVDALKDDIVLMRGWLISNGFTGYNHCAYPKGNFTGGAYNVLTTVSSYYTSCRTINQRHRETIPPSNALKLRVFYITNSTTLAQVKAGIDNAVINKEWIILSFHKIVTTPVLSTEWATGDFSALLDYMQSKSISVKNIGDLL